jgi:hypothetical protein
LRHHAAACMCEGPPALPQELEACITTVTRAVVRVTAAAGRRRGRAPAWRDVLAAVALQLDARTLLFHVNAQLGQDARWGGGRRSGRVHAAAGSRVEACQCGVHEACCRPEGRREGQREQHQHTCDRGWGCPPLGL